MKKYYYFSEKSLSFVELKDLKSKYYTYISMISLSMVVILTIGYILISIINDADEKEINQIISENYEIELNRLQNLLGETNRKLDESNIKITERLLEITTLMYKKAQIETLYVNRKKELNREVKELEYLLNTKKDAIEILYKIQEAKRNKQIWDNRLIGFISGLISSVIGGFIIRKYRKPVKIYSIDEKEKTKIFMEQMKKGEAAEINAKDNIIASNTETDIE